MSQKPRMNRSKLDRVINDIKTDLSIMNETFVEESSHINSSEKNDRIKEIEGYEFAIGILQAYKDGIIK